MLFLWCACRSLLRHKNLLNMVAVLTGDQPFYIVTELMVNGDLKDHLRACRYELAFSFLSPFL